MDTTDFVIETGLMVPMRDGERLNTSVYRPSAPGPHPVLLMRTPYGIESPYGRGGDLAEALGARLARRGYVHIAQDCRGRFGSEGVYHPQLSDIEDGYDTVEWA